MVLTASPGLNDDPRDPPGEQRNDDKVQVKFPVPTALRRLTSSADRQHPGYVSGAAVLMGRECSESRHVGVASWPVDPTSVSSKHLNCDKYGFMKRLNWQIWAGFILSLVAALSYEFVFARWPITRDWPWANMILFAIAIVLLFLGLRRAFKPDKRIVSKIFSSLAAAFGIFLPVGLLFVIFVAGRWLPASAAAPQVGQKAPDFTLTDPNNKPVTLAQLLSEPINNKRPKAVLLIFYRGYW
jgi:hypothetical protein